MPVINQEIFNRNLLLTQAYCEMQLANIDKSPAEILRSFNPEYEGKPSFSFEVERHGKFSWNTTKWAVQHWDSKPDWYPHLFETQLLHKQSIISEIEKQSIFAGRILVAEIDLTIIDGASEPETDGFIDGNDCPPIDTWFYMQGPDGDRTLFAWIPKQFVPLAQNAIDVNCVDCLEWYEDWLKKPITSNSRHTSSIIGGTTNYQKATRDKLKPFYIGKYEFSWQNIVRIITFLILIAWYIMNSITK